MTVRRPLLTLLLALLGAALASPPGDGNGAVEGDAGSDPSATLPYFELRRDDRPITVQQTATDAQGGIAITRGGSDCRKNENISFFYAPNPRRIETEVNNTRIRSNVVLRSQPKEGGAEAQDKAVLDFFAGSLGLDEVASCPRNVKRDKEGRVVVLEGRTTINGSSLLYTNADGRGSMAGPVNLERRQEGDSPALEADAQHMAFNIDNDITTLRGDVRVVSEGRTSRAEVLELDEESGFAILRGNPATSRDEEGEVRGQVIEYDLDSNDVVVRGSVEGTFDIDVGEGEGGDLPEVDTTFGSEDDEGATGGAEDGAGSEGDATEPEGGFPPEDEGAE